MKNFTLGITLFLLCFFANYANAQVRIPIDGEVRDSLYIWDNFNIEGDELTNENGITGEGWANPWTYQAGHTTGVLVGDGSITGTKGGFGISRNLINSIPLGESTFYLAFVVNKTEGSNFRIDGNRADGITRYAVGVGANGQLYANIAQTSAASIGAPGVVESNTTYLIISKWWYSGNKGHMNIMAYGSDDAIPTSEPEAGSWDLEGVGGATGVPIDYFRFFFASETATIYDFKVGDTWSSVANSILIPPSNVEALGISPTEVRVNWSDNSFKEDGFRIYLNGNEVTTVGPNVTEYTFSGLTSGQTYTFGVAAFDGDVETTVVELEYEFEFDPTPPVVVSTTPENNETDVVEISDIVLRFSKVMNTASVEGAISVEPALENAQYVWSAGGTVLTISADSLMFLTQYTVTIGTAASDLAGITMESAYVLSFTTIEQDLTPPTIISISPANNATDLLVTTNILITFSEAMNRASVEEAITITPALTNKAFSWIADSVVSIKGNKLAVSTQYTVAIANTATDLAGNALVEATEISFTTGASQLMLYDDFSVADGVLTSTNMTTGDGWAGPWRYSSNPGAVNVLNEYISGGTSTSIIRPLNLPFAIASTTYYMSFLAVRSPEGAFDILGGRLFGGNWQPRTGVGVNRDGTFRFTDHSGQPPATPEASGIMEENTTYLVVFKHTHRQKQQVKLFKVGDAITEPGDGMWDAELPTGITGINMDYVGIIFNNAAANIDELKVGLSWDEVVPTTITDMTEFPLAAPTGVKATASSASTVWIEWFDHSVVEEGFNIYLNGTKVKSVGEDEQFAVLRDLTEGETYTVSVAAYKGAEEAFSSEISFEFEFDADNFVNTRIFSLRAPAAPVIDGIVDEAWENAIKHPVRFYDPETEGPPLHEDDFQTTWSVMWDDDNLYFLFEVIDDVLMLSDGTGGTFGSSDGFEIPMANASRGAWTLNRLNLIKPTEEADKELYIHQGMTAFQNAQKAFALTEKGYNIELSMVLRDFDESIGLFVDGYTFRMDVRYIDSDLLGVRHAQYTWTNKNAQDWAGGSITSLGHVTLLEEDPTVGTNEPHTQKPDITMPVVYLSNSGTTLNVMHYEGTARLFSITGMQIMSIQDATQPVNVSHLPRGVYILNTKVGSVKFIK